MSLLFPCKNFVAKKYYGVTLYRLLVFSLVFVSPGLFTLILAAVFPSNSSDRFTLSKLLAVALW